MSYNKDYIITTLSGNMEQYSVSTVGARAPIIPTGRIRQANCGMGISGSGGAPYTVTNGTSKKFPLGRICYNGDWVCGKVGNYALNFPGTNDYVIIGAGSDWGWMNGKGDAASFTWSVSFWMKFNETPSGVDTTAFLFETHDNTANSANTGIDFAFYDSGGFTRALIARIFFEGTSTALGATLYPDDMEWHHIVVTMDRLAEEIEIFVDGSRNFASAGMARGGDVDAQSGLTIGLANTAAGLGFPFNGKLDDFAIWNVVLTAAEVNTLYNNGIGLPANSVQSSNIVGYWNFEDGPGSSTVKNYPSAVSASLNGTLTNMNAGSACDFPVKKPW